MTDEEIWIEIRPHIYAYLRSLSFGALLAFATGFGRGIGWWP